MNEYAEKKLQEYIYLAEYNWYDILEQTSTRLCYKDSIQTHTYEIVASMVERFVEQYPEYECAVIRSEDDGYITYSLELKNHDIISKWAYEYRKKDNTLEFWDYHTGKHTEISQQFQNAVEEMPEFRLRLLTGDITKIDNATN